LTQLVLESCPHKLPGPKPIAANRSTVNLRPSRPILATTRSPQVGAAVFSRFKGSAGASRTASWAFFIALTIFRFLPAGPVCPRVAAGLGPALNQGEGWGEGALFVRRARRAVVVNFRRRCHSLLTTTTQRSRHQLAATTNFLVDQTLNPANRSIALRFPI
jgi:hypothetical protein